MWVAEIAKQVEPGMLDNESFMRNPYAATLKASGLVRRRQDVRRMLLDVCGLYHLNFAEHCEADIVWSPRAFGTLDWAAERFKGAIAQASVGERVLLNLPPYRRLRNARHRISFVRQTHGDEYFGLRRKRRAGLAIDDVVIAEARSRYCSLISEELGKTKLRQRGYYLAAIGESALTVAGATGLEFNGLSSSYLGIPAGAAILITLAMKRGEATFRAAVELTPAGKLPPER